MPLVGDVPQASPTFHRASRRTVDVALLPRPQGVVGLLAGALLDDLAVPLDHRGKSPGVARLDVLHYVDSFCVLLRSRHIFLVAAPKITLVVVSVKYGNWMEVMETFVAILWTGSWTGSDLRV